MSDTMTRAMQPDTTPQLNPDTSGYGQDSTAADPSSYSTRPDADPDSSPTLYSPVPASFYRQMSDSFPQGASSYPGDQASSLPGVEQQPQPQPPPPRPDSYPPGPYSPQQDSTRSGKSLFGFVIGLLLLTVIGILLGLWLSDAI